MYIFCSYQMKKKNDSLNQLLYPFVMLKRYFTNNNN